MYVIDYLFSKRENNEKYIHTYSGTCFLFFSFIFIS